MTLRLHGGELVSNLLQLVWPMWDQFPRAVEGLLPIEIINKSLVFGPRTKFFIDCSFSSHFFIAFKVHSRSPFYVQIPWGSYHLGWFQLLS